jgi:hypothetical protein
MPRARLSLLLIPTAALLAILPLLFHGCSCGHDFDFHLLSWMEVARQFSHGALHPHWAFSAAWNAGEPRFVFYPPVSWTLGAILGLVFPWTWTPILYTWLTLTFGGLALYYLARNFASPSAALLAAVVYTVNPYMLFTAYERTAYAELLAAAWIPLLLHAILRRDITIPRIALPIALLWLTNAPAAVMSCYALALLALLRLLSNESNQEPHIEANTPPDPQPLRSSLAKKADTPVGHARTASLPTSHPPQSRLLQARNTLAGTLLGLGLAAFYITPAAYQRRFVQVSMALVPGTRIQDNFLFHHIGDHDHDAVLHTASLLAILLLLATAATLIASFLRRRRYTRTLAVTALAIALMLTPLTAVLWRNAPELAFLQFPWRLLALLAAIFSLSLALAFANLLLKPATMTIAALCLAATLVYPAYRLFHQTCDPEDTVSSRLTAFRSHQGVEPTDEYTPNTADNDSLAPANPAFWLSPDPSAKAPANAPPAPAPMHLTLTSPTPQNLILNLRDYPAWRITRNGILVTAREQRDDGLIALPLPPGTSTLSIAYAHTFDQTAGDAITILSLLLLLL